jgi:hypothetical protein
MKITQSYQDRLDQMQAWSKSRWCSPLLAMDEHNYSVLGTALLDVETLSIQSISETVHKLGRKLHYLESGETPAVQKTVPAQAPKPVQLTEKQRSDLLERQGIYTKRRDSFDQAQDAEDRAKKEYVMDRSEKDRRAISHYKNEAQTIVDLISGYSFPSSKAVEEFRKNQLRQIEVRDPADGFLLIPVMLEMTEKMISSFSDDTPGPERDRVIKEVTKGLLAKAVAAGPYKPKGR